MWVEVPKYTDNSRQTTNNRARGQGATAERNHRDGLVPHGRVFLDVKCPFWKKTNGIRVHTEIPPHCYLQSELRALEATASANATFFAVGSGEGGRSLPAPSGAELADLLRAQGQALSKRAKPSSSIETAALVAVES